MSKATLLVLDDEPRILTSIEDLFEDDNDVLTTTDPSTALLLLQKHDVAVILTDERMPGLSGHEFLRQARELSRATRVMISGYADLGAVTEAVNGGHIFAYVSKPWSPPELREMVRAAVIHFQLIQAVHHERELLRALMEGIPDPIYFKDLQSRITRTNREHARILGAESPESCVGKLESDFLQSEGAQWAVDEEQEIVRSGQAIIDRVERVKVAGGGRRWMSTTKVPIAGKDGIVSGLACISRDITNLKDIEETLRRESARLQLLQAVTVAANESSTIERAAEICLERICSHNGWSVGHLCLLAPGSDNELISTGLWHVQHDERFEAFRKASEGARFAIGAELPGQVLASGKPVWIGDVTEPYGSRRCREARAAGLRSGFGLPILVDNSVMGVLEFFSPQEASPPGEFLKLMEIIGAQLGQVSLRQRAKEDLHKAKLAAESANLAKTEFLATVSHEMRTPLNAILGMAEVLSETSLSPEQRNFVNIFIRGGAQLLELINDLLDLSKVESGSYELDVIDFELSAILEGIIEIMRPRAEAKGLRLSWAIAPGVPLRLLGDPARLRQVLVNLIGNAVKFTEKGSISLRIEPDPASTGEGALRFSVADTGIGIAPQKKEIIFGRFTQADSSTTRKYGGTGLGLAITKGLVLRMGGEIGVTSEIGKGSTFHFTSRFGTRPRPDSVKTVNVTAHLRAADPPPGAAGSPDVTHILIVEDSQDNLLLIETYLKGPRFQLDIAANGMEAVEKVACRRYDLVLMDVQMPVMDGHTAARVIRLRERSEQAPPVPILALTAHAMQDEIERSLQAGCSGHLTKPISKATLLAAIAHHTAAPRGTP